MAEFTRGSPGGQLGPDTYAFQTGGPVQAEASYRASQATAGGVGRGVQNTSTVGGVVPDDVDIGTIFKLGAKLLEPMVQREQQKQFVAGMARAAAGEAAKDIAEEQSWISTLYGNNHTELGARAYEAEQDSALIDSELTSAMPELRELPTQEAFKRAGIMIEGQALEIKDPLRRQMFQADAYKRLSTWGRLQAKEHAQFNQEKAQRAYQGRTDAVYQAVDGRLKALVGNTGSDQERELVLQSLGKSFEVAPGQDPQQAALAHANSMMALAREGKFEAIQAAQKVGIMDALPAQVRAQLLNAVQAEADQAAPRALLPAQWARLTGILNDSSQDAEQVATALDKFNADMREVNRIPGDAYSRALYGGVIRQQENEREQEARLRASQSSQNVKDFLKAQKEAQELALMDAGWRHLAQGTLSWAEVEPTMPSGGRDYVTNKALQAFSATTNPAEQATLAYRAGPLLSPVVKAKIDRAINQDKFTPEATQMAQMMAAWPGGVEAAGLGRQETAFIRAMLAGGGGEQAFAAAKYAAQIEAPFVAASAREQESILAALDDGYSLQGESRSMVAAAAFQEASIRGGSDLDGKSKVAVAEVQSRFETYSDGFAVLKTNKDQPNVSEWLGKKGVRNTPGEVARGIKQVLFRAYPDLKMDAWALTRRPDMGDGTPVYIGWANRLDPATDTMKTVTVTFTGTQLQDFLKDRKKFNPDQPSAPAEPAWKNPQYNR